MFIAYLHGFASGPGSSKGQYFHARLAEHGLDLLVPDLTRGDFTTMTISRAIEVVGQVVAAHSQAPITLIGSSLGGYIAALYAARHPDLVARVVLLAPAFEFGRQFAASLDPDVLATWRARGWTEVQHYGERRLRRLSVTLLDDAAGYEDLPDVSVPTLVFHGQHDDVVDPALSERFAHSRPNVQRVVLDSDHELRDVLELMWERMAPFLGLARVSHQ